MRDQKGLFDELPEQPPEQSGPVQGGPAIPPPSPGVLAEGAERQTLYHTWLQCVAAVAGAGVGGIEHCRMAYDFHRAYLTEQLQIVVDVVGRQGLSRYSICKASGMSQGALSEFVAGKRPLNLEAAGRLATACGWAFRVRPQHIVWEFDLVIDLLRGGNTSAMPQLKHREFGEQAVHLMFERLAAGRDEYFRRSKIRMEQWEQLPSTGREGTETKWPAIVEWTQGQLRKLIDDQRERGVQEAFDGMLKRDMQELVDGLLQGQTEEQVNQWVWWRRFDQLSLLKQLYWILAFACGDEHRMQQTLKDIAAKAEVPEQALKELADGKRDKISLEAACRVVHAAGWAYRLRPSWQAELGDVVSELLWKDKVEA
jgi:plasmid maintenance system antidote protein VapI